jgi:hypothetical protein
MRDVNLSDTASLAIATLDLLLVQDLIGAIRAADLGAAQAAAGAPSPASCPTPECPRHVHLDDVVEPRRVIHQSPCYERCRVPAKAPLLHALPRVALSAPDAGAAAGGEVARGHEGKSPIQPPWAVQPWQEPAKVPAQIKVVVHRTDIISKGSLIDIFV